MNVKRLFEIENSKCSKIAKLTMAYNEGRKDLMMGLLIAKKENRLNDFIRKKISEIDGGLIDGK